MAANRPNTCGNGTLLHAWVILGSLRIRISLCEMIAPVIVSGTSADTFSRHRNFSNACITKWYELEAMLLVQHHCLWLLVHAQGLGLIVVRARRGPDPSWGSLTRGLKWGRNAQVPAHQGLFWSNGKTWVKGIGGRYPRGLRFSQPKPYLHITLSDLELVHTKILKRCFYVEIVTQPIQTESENYSPSVSLSLHLIPQTSSYRMRSPSSWYQDPL